MQVNLLMPIRRAGAGLTPLQVCTTKAQQLTLMNSAAINPANTFANINQILHIHKSKELMGLAHGRELR